MRDLYHLYEQLVAWLTRIIGWVTTAVQQLWLATPYHAIIGATVRAWYGAGYLTIAGIIVGVLVGLWWVRRWAGRVVRRTHYQRYCELNQYLLVVIRLGRDNAPNDVATMTTARRHFRQYFYTHQLDFTPDSELRRTMRDLVNQVDDDAALFHEKVELKNAYQLHTIIETQCAAYPRRIRWLYRLSGGR